MRLDRPLICASADLVSARLHSSIFFWMSASLGPWAAALVETNSAIATHFAQCIRNIVLTLLGRCLAFSSLDKNSFAP